MIRPRKEVTAVGEPPPLKAEQSPALVVEDVRYDIVMADRRHHRYICTTLGKTLPQHDQTLSSEAAFAQGLCLVTARDWFCAVATPDGDEILGFILYHTAEQIGWVQVKAMYRGRGIGQRLLGWPMVSAGFDKHTATPFASETGWEWARRRGWTPHLRPNLVWKAMDKLCKHG